MYGGLFVTLLGHGLWYESLVELGIQPYYNFRLSDAITWSIYILPFPILICMATSSLKNCKKPLRIETRANIAALTNLVTTYCAYTFLCYFIPTLLHPFSLSFVFIFAGIIGISTFYFVLPPTYEILRSNNIQQETEALKLEHDWIWRAINIISWAIVILVASAILTSWTQVILPAIPPEKRYTYAFTKIEVQSVIEIIYLVVGLWFGILGKFMEYSWRIRKRIAQLDSYKNGS